MPTELLTEALKERKRKILFKSMDDKAKGGSQVDEEGMRLLTIQMSLVRAQEALLNTYIFTANPFPERKIVKASRLSRSRIPRPKPATTIEEEERKVSGTAEKRQFCPSCLTDTVSAKKRRTIDSVEVSPVAKLPENTNVFDRLYAQRKKALRVFKRYSEPGAGPSVTSTPMRSSNTPQAKLVSQTSLITTPKSSVTSTPLKSNTPQSNEVSQTSLITTPEASITDTPVRRSNTAQVKEVSQTSMETNPEAQSPANESKEINKKNSTPNVFERLYSMRKKAVKETEKRPKKESSVAASEDTSEVVSFRIPAIPTKTKDVSARSSRRERTCSESSGRHLYCKCPYDSANLVRQMVLMPRSATDDVAKALTHLKL